MLAGITIRAETAQDQQAIEILTLVAFMQVEHSQHNEHRIIEELRAEGALTVSLVAEHEGYVVGQAAASPVTLSDGSRGWYGLGPVSVGPGHRGQGIGSALVRAVLQQLQEIAAAGCVVLGDPGFYARFGFSRDPALVLPGVPPEFFQIQPFGEHLPPIGEVEYHPAFAVTG